MESIIENGRVTWESESAAQITAMMREKESGDLAERRLRAALYVQFRHGDMAYYMFEKGAITEERLRSALRPLPLYGPTGRTFWSSAKASFVDSYVDYVDSLVAEGFYAAPN